MPLCPEFTPSGAATVGNGRLDRALNAVDEPFQRVKLFDALAAFPSHTIARFGMGPEVFDRLPKRDWVARRYKDAVDTVDQHVALSVHLGADHGLAHRHRFGHRGDA